jgi:hypothetical protein
LCHTQRLLARAHTPADTKLGQPTVQLLALRVAPLFVGQRDNRLGPEKVLVYRAVGREHAGRAEELPHARGILDARVVRLLLLLLLLVRVGLVGGLLLERRLLLHRRCRR